MRTIIAIKDPLQPEPGTISIEDCSICLETISINNLVKTVCNHSFHILCLENWLNQNESCPLCRKMLNKRASIKPGLDTHESIPIGLSDQHITRMEYNTMFSRPYQHISPIMYRHISPRPYSGSLDVSYSELVRRGMAPRPYSDRDTRPYSRY